MVLDSVAADADDEHYAIFPVKMPTGPAGDETVSVKFVAKYDRTTHQPYPPHSLQDRYPPRLNTELGLMWIAGRPWTSHTMVELGGGGSLDRFLRRSHYR